LPAAAWAARSGSGIYTADQVRSFKIGNPYRKMPCGSGSSRSADSMSSGHGSGTVW
jgi:hypothetical protein